MIPHRSITSPSPRRIGVFRALQLGDMLCAVPALRSLRAAFPDAEITLIGLPWATTFVERFSHYVDAFLEFPGWPGLPEREFEPVRIPSFLMAAHARDFDVVVQMHGDGRVSNAIVAMLGARAIVGACADGAWRPPNGDFSSYPDDAPEPVRALAAVEPLGVSAATRRLEFPVFPADRDELRRIVGAAILCDAVVVHPGARAESRRWPPIYFAALADELAARGNDIIITGTAEERPLCEEVAAAMRHPSHVLAGETSLGALAALVEECRLVVCNDTGVSHLADALGTPSVVLVTASDPGRWAPEDRQAHRVVCYPETLDPRHALGHACDLLERRRAYAV